MSTPLPSGITKISKSYRADPRLIKRKDGFNPRFDFGEIAELAKSIAANGLLNPVRVKRSGEGFELIDGDRRLTAVELLLEQGETFQDGVPIILVDKDQDEVTSLVQMFEANTSKAFLPLEEAAAFKRMRDAGLTIKDICQRVGRTDVHVMDTLALLEADDSLKEAVASKQIGSSTAKQIAQVAKGDKKKQAELVQDLKDAGSDKKKKRAVLQKVAQVRAAKAEAKGKVVKMRALSDDQLSELGERVAKMLILKAHDAGLPANAPELLDAVKKDDKLVAAFTLGALEALKAAAGLKIELDL